MRENTRTVSRYSSQSKRALSVNGCLHKTGQVDRTQQAGTIGRQWLFTAGIGSADGLAKPVVVHLIDAVDEDETRLGKVIGRGHDHVPQVPGANVLIDTTGHQPFVVVT